MQIFQRLQADQWSQILTLLVGLSGGALAFMAGLPAAGLIGASLATALAASNGMKLNVKPGMRNSGFLFIGIMLGSGFEMERLANAGHWSFSLILLVISIFVTHGLSCFVLERGFGFDRGTAYLAASPGTISLSVSLASEGRGDLQSITILQSMRLLLLAAILPIGVSVFGVSFGGGEALPSTGLLSLAGLALVGAALALGFAKVKLPAAWLLAGMAVSAIAHIIGVVHGKPPDLLQFFGFVITGAVVGSRFTGITFQVFKRYFTASLASVGVAAAVSMLFAYAVSFIVAMPMPLVWIAFAPGGVEAMAAIAIALGGDPAFVAIHHLARISLLAVYVPMFCPKRD